MGRRADATLTNLFNSTSGRDAFHPCLISTWSKEWCTIVCVIVEGTNLSPIRYFFALGMGRGADASLTNLFNPTSERDASHPYLTSTWPKEGYTIVCMMWASLKNCAPMWDWGKPWGLGLHLMLLIPKRTILDWSSRLSFLPQV